MNDRTVRQQSSGSSSEWDMANDVFVTGYDDHASGEVFDSGLCSDGHLPLRRADSEPLSQDCLMLGLPGPDYPDPSFLNIEPDFSDAERNLSERRILSNSSRHRGEIVTELGPEEIRWFYKEDKRTWKPFAGTDSLKIERLYRRRTEQLDPGSDPAGGDGEQNPVPEEVKSPSDVKAEAVCVRGGLYEVHIREKECCPVYWNQQESIPVMRGQWFVDGTWLPLEEEDSNPIEMEHLSHFRGQQMRDVSESGFKGFRTQWNNFTAIASLSRSHVDWHSVDEVYLYSDATTSKIARTVTQKLGFSKASSSGTRLRRGYFEEAVPEETPSETTHIVFVVHGIGQKMDQGRIIRNTSMMRDAARKMEERHFPDRTTEHVEFLPVEWRSKLYLDGDTVDSITPDKVRGIRDMLNSSAMDIMYYTSPLYRDEITRGLTQELNRLYSLFCSRNPDFEKNGKVSIVAHSLGCVITFDIMTGWDPVRFHHQQMLDPEKTKIRWPSEEERQLQEQLRVLRLRLRDLEDQFRGLQTSSSVAVPALKFKVENFFCMGSPLAVFLALRGIRPGNNTMQDHILSTSICKRLFNLFHPTDPVAYRLEPLILKHYNNIAPVQIDWYNTTSPTLYDQIRPTRLNLMKDTSFVSEAELITSPCTSPPQTKRPYGESITSLGKASIMGAASIGKGIGGILFSRFSRSSGQVGGVEEEPEFLVSVELERRIDFELREGLVENRYWSAVTSHTAYWCSYDVALFLLTFMYRPQELHESIEDHQDAS
uniref:DDHD domain containing 1b n=1 Tax=Oryzias sinensis TaxID=183150 RepID=A0A8C7YBS6_9TELE